MTKQVIGDENEDFGQTQEELSSETKNNGNGDNIKSTENSRGSLAKQGASKNPNESEKNSRKTLEDEEEGGSEESEHDEEPSVGRRSSTRLRNSGKKMKIIEFPSSSEEEDYDPDDPDSDPDIYERETKRKPVVSKSKSCSRPRGRPRKYPVPELKAKDKDSQAKNSQSSKKCNDVSHGPKDFISGAYVVAKSDFHLDTTPPLWRIDGKALLQKYIPFERDGQTLYKNTSTYSGWNANNKHLYYPAKVDVQNTNRREIVVRFLKEKIEATDSD